MSTWTHPRKERVLETWFAAHPNRSQIQQSSAKRFSRNPKSLQEILFCFLMVTKEEKHKPTWMKAHSHNAYTHIHTETHAHIYTHAHIHAHTHRYAQAHIRMHTHIYTQAHIDTQTHAHTDTHVHVHTQIRAYINEHIHMYTQTHVHIYTYKQTHTHVHKHIYKHKLCSDMTKEFSASYGVLS